MIENLVTYQFAAEITGDVVFSDGPKPVFSFGSDRKSTLIGAFNVVHGNIVQAFISGVEFPEALKVSTMEGFYFTPCESDFNGKVSYGVVSEVSLNENSVLALALEVKR